MCNRPFRFFGPNAELIVYNIFVEVSKGCKQFANWRSVFVIVKTMSSLDGVRALLGKEVRVVLDDGRVIEGSLQCLDKDLNFIIGEASEYHGVSDGNNSLCLR